MAKIKGKVEFKRQLVQKGLGNIKDDAEMALHDLKVKDYGQITMWMDNITVEVRNVLSAIKQYE